MKKILIASSLWVLLWGCDTENNFHRLEVVNGTVLEGENPGEYKVGQNLTVEANDPPPNQAFSAGRATRPSWRNSGPRELP